MANVKLRKFKISIDPASESTQGLRENDIVIRQYVQKDLNQRFTLMYVNETGKELNAENKDVYYFIGTLLYGDAPIQEEILDFVRVGSFSESDRTGSILLSASDTNAPYINIINDLVKDRSLLYPTRIGSSELSSKTPKDILYTKGYVSGVKNVKNNEFTFTKTSSDVSGSEYSSSIAARIDKYAIRNGEQYVVFFEAKSSSDLTTECKISDENGLRENFKSSFSVTKAWKSYCFFFDVKEEYTQNLFQLAPFGKVANETNISVRNISIVNINKLSQYFTSSKATFGKLDGRYDETIGKLSGYGIYCDRLIATKSTEIIGSLSVGDESGSNNAFYVGKICKNIFPNSTLIGLDGKAFFSSDKQSSILARQHKMINSPIGEGVSLMVSSLGSENSFITIPLGSANVTSNICTFSLYYRADFNAWMSSGSYITVSCKNSAGDIVETFTYNGILSIGAWDRVSEVLYLSDNVKQIDINLHCCIANTFESVYLGGVQVENGDTATIYQETSEIVEDEDYGFWAKRGGIGGTIQSPLVKFFPNGSIASKGETFKIMPDGSATYKGTFVVEGKNGEADKTIIVGGNLNTQLIEANSIKANMIDVKELTAVMITTETIEGLDLTFVKGKIGNWSIESNQLKSTTATHEALIASDNGISFRSLSSGKYGFKVNIDGTGNICDKAIVWDGNSVVFGESVTIQWSSINGAAGDRFTNIGANGIYTGTLNADQVKAGTIDANIVNVVNLNASNIVAGTIDASTINLINLNASNITSGEIDASVIKVKNLDASSIVSGEIDASIIKVKNIDASNIKTGTITVGGSVSGVGLLNIFDSSDNVIVSLSGDINRIAGWYISRKSISAPSNKISIESDKEQINVDNGRVILGNLTNNMLVFDGGIGSTKFFESYLQGGSASYEGIHADGQGANVSVVDKYGLCVSDSNNNALVYLDGVNNFISGWVLSPSEMHYVISGKKIFINPTTGFGVSDSSVSYFNLKPDGSGHIGRGGFSWDSLGNITLSDKVSITWKSVSDVLGGNFTQIDGNTIYTGTLNANQINAGTISSNYIVVDSQLVVGGTSNGSILVKNSSNEVIGSISKDGIKVGSQTVQDYVGGAISGVQGSIDGINAYVDGVLKKALSGTTAISGGLILSSAMVLGQTVNGVFSIKSGISGICNADAIGGGIAAWYGGSMKDRANYTSDTMPDDVAKGVDRFDGSGYRANGKLSWSKDGEVSLATQYFNVVDQTGTSKFEYDTSRGILVVRTNMRFNVESSLDTLNGSLMIDDLIQNIKFNKVSGKVDSVSIKKNTNIEGSASVGGSVVATGDVVSKKTGSVVFAVSDSGGSGLQYLHQLLDVDIPTPSNNQSLVYSSGSQKWINKTLTAGDVGALALSWKPTWEDVTGKPTTFTPSAHTQAMSTITGLQDALNGKQPSGNYEAAFTKNSAFNKNFGSSAGTVCEGNDSRLSDSRPASDVYPWAKAETKPSYDKDEVGLGNVDNTSDADKPISTATQSALNLKANKNGDSTEDFSVKNLTASGYGLFQGDVVSKKTGSVVFSISDASGGSQYLHQLLDVEIPTPKNGDVLMFDGSKQKWVNISDVSIDAGVYAII